MTATQFDERAIQWTTFGDFVPSFQYRILSVDETSRIVDVLFKFPANEQIVLHRHRALNHTFVVQGEHRLYEVDGGLREIRPAGSYTVSPASELPHREGGGERDVLIVFSIRPDDGEEVLYELLDDALNPLGAVTYQMLVELYAAQQASAPGRE